MQNQWKIFEKMTKNLNFDLFRGPKWPGNRASEADIQPTSKSSSNWHVNQDWCETSGKFLKKGLKTRIFTYLGPQMIWKSCLWGPYSTHYQLNWCKSSVNILRIWPKKKKLNYSGAQNGLIIGPLMPIFYNFFHTFTFTYLPALIP